MTGKEEAYITADWMPLKDAVAAIVGERFNASTIWRWCHRGFKKEGSENIKLQVRYVGRTPYTTRTHVKAFFDAITAAKQSRSGKRKADAKALDERQQEAELESRMMHGE